MIYGMGEDSWCLVRLPKYFTPTSETELSQSRGNLTYTKRWVMDFSDSPWTPFKDQYLYLTYHAGEDVWPEHTNDLHLTNLLAPYGQQRDGTIGNDQGESDGFRTYMACGNNGDEGESGETYDSLLIEEVQAGFSQGSVDNNLVEQNTIEDFSFTFRLEDDYPIGPYCLITVEWKSANFQVDTLTMNGVNCTVGSDTATCLPGTTIRGGADLRFDFTNVYVISTVSSSDTTVTTEVVDFLSDIFVLGDWVSYGSASSSSSQSSWNGYVYYCKKLDGNEDCGSVQQENVQITVERATNLLKINKVRTSPNNLRATNLKWYSDLFIEFEM